MFFSASLIVYIDPIEREFRKNFQSLFQASSLEIFREATVNLWCRLTAINSFRSEMIDSETTRDSGRCIQRSFNLPIQGRSIYYIDTSSSLPFGHRPRNKITYVTLRAITPLMASLTRRDATVLYYRLLRLS